jgi:hypothetical protein
VQVDSSDFIRSSFDSGFQMRKAKDIHYVSETTLHCYSKCYFVASITKTFTLKGLQIIHRSRRIANNLDMYRILHVIKIFTTLKCLSKLMKFIL